MNQRSRKNSVSNRTSDPLIAPITPEQLADFLGLDYDPSDDALLESFILATSQFYIATTNNELLQRNYIMKFDSMPLESPSVGGLSPVYGYIEPWLNLGVWPVESVSALYYDDVVQLSPEVDLDSKPARVFVDNYAVKIQADYLAGYTTAEKIPANVLQGITAMSAYLYEHRGSCSAAQAAKDSGAMTMWRIESIMVTL